MFALYRPLALRTLLTARSSSFSTSTTSAAIPRYALGRSSVAIAAVVFGTSVALLSHRTVHLDGLGLSEPEPIQLDPDTSIAFPTTLVIPSKIRLPPFTLIGIGVRRVSFLGVKVYSVGFYADLANPALNIPAGVTSEEKIAHIISNTACVLRIVPTRTTSYSHLRDGFMRALQARMSLCFKRGTISEAEAELTQTSLRKFKSMFPSTPLAKHIPLDILLTAPPKYPNGKRSLIVRDLGAVEDDWVAREFVMAYFEGDGISPPMKKSVIEALQRDS